MGKSRRTGAAAAGFSLIELMFVVAIVGIIAMVAIPSYTKQIQKNNRAVAKARLAQAAQLLERFYSDNNSYYVNTSGSPCVLSVGTGASSELQNGLMKILTPSWACTGSNTVYSGSNNESTSVYTLTLSTPSANSYTLTATPVAGTTQVNDTKCMNLTLTNAGVKGISGSGALTDCW